jgi:hypothetical protein
VRPSYLIRGFPGHPLQPPFVHGMRVLNLVDEPAERAVRPGGRDKEMAEGR